MQGLEIKNSPTELSVKAMPSLSLCLCAPHLSTCVHVCEGPRPMSGAVLQLRLGLLLQWDSSSRLGCVSREPQGSFRLHLPRAGIIGAHHQACFSLYAGDGIQALTPMWPAPDWPSHLPIFHSMTESKHCEGDTGAGPVKEAQQELGGGVLHPVPIRLRKTGGLSL